MKYEHLEKWEILQNEEKKQRSLNWFTPYLFNVQVWSLSGHPCLAELTNSSTNCSPRALF